MSKAHESGITPLMGFVRSDTQLVRQASTIAVAILLVFALTGCGLLRVEASGSNDHVDWSVGVPF